MWPRGGRYNRGGKEGRSAQELVHVLQKEEGIGRRQGKGKTNEGTEGESE